MLKKVLIISIVFFVLALGIAGYFIFIKDPTGSTNGVVDSNQGPFPFSGNSTGTPQQPPSSDEESINSVNGIVTSRLSQLSKEPISGAGMLTQGTTTLVRYNERSTGHIFEVNLTTGTSSRLSNTTIPKIYESLFAQNANTSILRYLNDSGTIQTYAAVLQKKPATTTDQLRTIRGIFLPEGIEEIVVSPNASQIFYIVSNGSGVTGFLAQADGTKPQQVFTSPLYEWAVAWPGETTITLTTKASSIHPGFSYVLNTKTGVLQKKLGDIKGLTTNTNSTGSLIAYTNSTNALQVYDTVKGTTFATGLLTFAADKCVWSKKSKNILYCSVPTYIGNGLYPDTWYQGRVSFADDIYKIDATLNAVSLIASITKDNKVDIDATNLSLSQNEDYLTFTNKKDLTLWGMKVSP